MSSLTQKLISFSELEGWRELTRRARQKLVVTNGCFDIVHAGHITLLEKARSLGGFLLVGLNSDAAVRELKGSDRPINCISDRLQVIAAMEAVDACVEFDDVRAVEFLRLSAPDVWVKGGDYTTDTLDAGERQAVQFCGGDIVLIEAVEGRSTTRIVNAFKHG